MKNVVLSVVVIAALVVAGIGGTLADFSDSEEEIGDRIQAGSLDLKVNGADDPDVAPFSITGMVPDKWYDYTKTVANVGTIDGYLYLHVKNVLCTETNDKDLNGDGEITVPEDNPEPENVAELGGKHGQAIIDPGLGVRCDMEEHVEIEIWFGPVQDSADPSEWWQVDLSALDSDQDGIVTLAEVECNQIHLTTEVIPLPACGAEWKVNFMFKLHDVPEDFYGLDYMNAQTDPNGWFEFWPTNCYQGDTVSFDLLFALLQTDYTPPGGGN